MTIYLDCNATTPVEQAVQEIVIKYMCEEFGNAGSRTHTFGARAQQAVQRARETVSKVVNAKPEEIVFTSGATESNNLALLGLARHGKETGRKHIISTGIEHKSVLEPLEVLAAGGFEVDFINPDSSGRVKPESVYKFLREDTLLVSVMHVNNETGVIQPIQEVASLLEKYPAFFHVDAAQGFGKDIAGLRNTRIDLISISGHKIYAPKGIGALVTRRRNHKRPPITPLLYGGGQEYGLRPGTLPVPLIVGLGLAADLAMKNSNKRAEVCKNFRADLLTALKPLGPIINGDPEYTMPHVINISFCGIDSEALMLALKNIVAISNGSACTSLSYKPSHVLKAMNLTETVVRGAVRLSWSHMTEKPDWEEVIKIIKRLQ